MSEEINRRRFLKSVAGVGGVVALGSWPALSAEMQDSSLAPSSKFFNTSQAAIVQAITQQIVPADDYGGGKDAGVLFFIDGFLAGPFGRFYKERYQEGLNLIETVSHRQFGEGFTSVSFDQQTAILEALESGAHGSPGKEFFALILAHSMEGYYGDPKHGGNHGRVSWKMIGFEG